MDIQKIRVRSRQHRNRPTWSRDFNRIFVRFVSIEIEADGANDNKCLRDCAGRRGKIEKGEGREEGGGLIRRSLGAISASRPFFLRRAILLCLNEVGDLARPRGPPRFAVHRRQFRSIGSSFLQFRLEGLVSSRPPSSLSSVRFVQGWSVRFLPVNRDSARGASCEVNLLE